MTKILGVTTNDITTWLVIIGLSTLVIVWSFFIGWYHILVISKQFTFFIYKGILIFKQYNDTSIIGHQISTILLSLYFI